ncbi:tyrosine-type recombinase/integrase, partial [Streptococcus pyogenes]
SNNMVAYFSICLTRSGKEATPIQTLEQHEEDALDLFLSTHISRRNLGIMLSLYCGLRIGEVCALQWTDIDTKNAIL